MFKRQSQEVRELMPELYLHGLASGDFELALCHLLGNGAPLSVSSLQRLKEKWQDEYRQWTNAPIEEGCWAYLWADGIYVKAGLGKEKAALLVVIGVKSDGSKCFWKPAIARAKSRGPVSHVSSRTAGESIPGSLWAMAIWDYGRRLNF
jgi:transposase-like protein